MARNVDTCRPFSCKAAAPKGFSQGEELRSHSLQNRPPRLVCLPFFRSAYCVPFPFCHAVQRDFPKQGCAQEMVASGVLRARSHGARPTTVFAVVKIDLGLELWD